MIKKKNYEMCLISTTHWDREYVFSDEKTRMMLVEMMDNLLDILDANPDYKHFHLDSQTSPLDDYLEIRPENEAKLKKYIKEGRILVGPWYTLPDEFLVSGESLIRNLQLGYKKAKEFGKVMKVGYNVFSWGQISQLPQLYRGFGIDTAIFYRGINRSVAPKLEFRWRSPDGSEILGMRFGEGYRLNFMHFLYLPVVFGRKHHWGYIPYYDWKNQKEPLFHLCDDYSEDPHHYLDDVAFPFLHEEKIPECIAELKETVINEATTPYLLFVMGWDSGRPYPHLPMLIEKINKLLKGGKLIHGSLPDYMDKVKKAVDKKKLKVLEGEMRHPNNMIKGGESWPPLFASALSARMPIKQANCKTELSLEKWAEPTSAFAWMLGKEYPKVFLERAWKLMILNQHHDGIGGTHIDKVSRSILERYSQCNEIAEKLIWDNLKFIGSQIDTTDAKDGDISLLVFNPSPYERTEVVTATIDFPREERIKSFTLSDFQENEIAPQSIWANDLSVYIHQPYDYPLYFKSRRFKFHFEAADIPALGYKTFKVNPAKTVRRNKGSLITASNIMENKFLRVEIKSDGRFRLTNKDGGSIYDNLHFFEDSGEVGGPCLHSLPEANEVFTSIGNPVSVSLIEDGPLLATFKIEIKMLLPEKAETRKRMYPFPKPDESFYPLKRSESKKEFIITSFVTLRKGSKRVEILTRLDNNIEDHRLRVLFPSGVRRAQDSYAEGQFDVLKRKISLPDSSEWAEAAVGTHPQRYFVDVNDGKDGLAIINQGIPEYEVIDDKERTIALTLLRCFRSAAEFRTEPEEPGAQCPGKHEFRYAIYPHRGNWEELELYREAYGFNLPLRVAQQRKTSGSLPNQMSFLKIEPANLILSAVKKSGEDKSLVIRLFNPTGDNLKGKISFYRKIKKVRLINLNEEAEKELNLKNKNSIALNVETKKIISLEIFFDERKSKNKQRKREEEILR